MSGFEENVQKPDFLAENGQKWQKSRKQDFFLKSARNIFYTHQDVALCKKSSKSDARFSRYALTDERTDERTNERA